MNKKVLYKIIIALIICIIILLLNSNMVLGTINTNITIGNRYINEAKPVGDRITGVLKVVGTFVAVGMTMVVGIKYMLCSVEEKAEYKKTALLYIIGAILIFATTQVISLISDIIN